MTRTRCGNDLGKLQMGKMSASMERQFFREFNMAMKAFGKVVAAELAKKDLVPKKKVTRKP